MKENTFILLTSMKSNRSLMIRISFIELVSPISQNCEIITSDGRLYKVKESSNFILSNIASGIIRPSESDEFNKVKDIKPVKVPN